MRSGQKYCALLTLFAVVVHAALAEDERTDNSPDNQLAWRMIQRAQTGSGFSVKNMKITVRFVVRDGPATETGTYIDEANDTSSREALKYGSYSGSILFLPERTEVVGDYLNQPAEVARVRSIVERMAHPKVGPFYGADRFGAVVGKKIEGRQARCVSFDRNLSNFAADGSALRESGEICFDSSLGVVLRHKRAEAVWIYSKFARFGGKLLPRKIVFQEPPSYRIEGIVAFAKLKALGR